MTKVNDEPKEVIKMKIPGFTAEASFYKSTGRYLMAGSSSNVRDLEVLPALRRWFHSREWWNCAANCMSDCLSGAADPLGIKGVFGFEPQSLAGCASSCDTHCSLLYDW
jgi:hypothetical protein